MLCILNNDGQPVYKIEISTDIDAIVFCNKVWIKESVYDGVAHFKNAKTYVARQLSYIKPEEK